MIKIALLTFGESELRKTTFDALDNQPSFAAVIEGSTAPKPQIKDIKIRKT